MDIAWAPLFYLIICSLSLKFGGMHDTVPLSAPKSIDGKSVAVRHVGINTVV